MCRPPPPLPWFPYLQWSLILKSREHCGCLHQGHISSFSNPFASTGLSLGFAPPEPELESLTFCLLFCSVTLGLKMPVPLSCGLHVINHPSLFLPLYLCRTQGVGQLVVACSHSLGSGGHVAIILPLLIWPSSSCNVCAPPCCAGSLECGLCCWKCAGCLETTRHRLAFFGLTVSAGLRVSASHVLFPYE